MSNFIMDSKKQQPIGSSMMNHAMIVLLPRIFLQYACSNSCGCYFVSLKGKTCILYYKYKILLAILNINLLQRGFIKLLILGLSQAEIT